MLSIDVLEITLHSAAAEEIINNYITFLDPGGINYVIIVGPTVSRKLNCSGKLPIVRKLFPLHPFFRIPFQRLTASWAGEEILSKELSGTGSAILNQESSDTESCDSNCAIPLSL